jgi:hypothetical protein
MSNMKIGLLELSEYRRQLPVLILKMLPRKGICQGQIDISALMFLTPLIAG